jgi:AraC-like DNA-binding protein
MENVTFTNLIGIIISFILMLLTFFIYTTKSTNSISNKLFATYLLLNAIEFTGFYTSLLFNEPNNLLVASREFSYLQMPVLFLYILSVCYSDFKLQWKHLWHVLPYIIGNLVMLPRFYLGSTAQKTELFNNFNSLYESYFAHIALHLQSIIYLTACFIVLKRAKKIFKENYSSGTITIYNWLFQLILFTALLYGFAVIKNGLKFFGEPEFFEISHHILVIIVLVVVCWYVLKALKYPQLFSGVNSKIELTKDLSDQSNLLENKEEVEKLSLFMTENKPYLDPSLTLRNLASSIQMNSRDLSVLINQNLNKHFFDFVNEYRIEEAKNILKDPIKKEFTVLEILYEVGFNSKSSFNTAFKKHTGLTPTQFRKNR